MVSNRKDRPLFGSRDLFHQQFQLTDFFFNGRNLDLQGDPFSGFFQTLQGAIVRDVVSERCRSAPKSLWIGRSKVGVTEKALDVEERSSFRPEKTRVFGVLFLGGSVNPKWSGHSWMYPYQRIPYGISRPEKHIFLMLFWGPANPKLLNPASYHSAQLLQITTSLFFLEAGKESSEGWYHTTDLL